MRSLRIFWIWLGKLLIFYVKTWYLPLDFFPCGKMFFKFFLFWNSSIHINDHRIMKIEICTLSEFSEFDLEKTFFFQILKKKKIVLKSFLRLKKPIFFLVLSVRTGQDLNFFQIWNFFFEVGIYMVTAFNSKRCPKYGISNFSRM